jgi:hypothetical protein
VENPAIVGVLDGIGEVGDQPGSQPWGDWLGLLPQPGRQRRPLAIRRDDVGEGPDLPGLEHRDDVGMIEAGRGTPLAEESPPGLGRDKHLGSGYLQCDLATENRVASQVDDPKATLPELPDHLESAQAHRGLGERVRCWSRGRFRLMGLQPLNQFEESRQVRGG